MKPELIILLLCGGAMVFSQDSEEQKEQALKKEKDKTKEDTKQRTKTK